MKRQRINDDTPKTDFIHNFGYDFILFNKIEKITPKIVKIDKVGQFRWPI